jgi:hypothetical protein
MSAEPPLREDKVTFCMTPPSPSSDDIKRILIDLCASFVSANGVNPKFYFAAGQALVEGSYVSTNCEDKLIVRVTEDEIFNQLIGMGHPRGAYVARLVANRICRCIDQINELGGTVFLHSLGLSDYTRIEEMLLPLFGVGPIFVKVYCLLAGFDGIPID